MSEPKCVVCSTRSERARQTVFENDAWRATLGANQGYLGTLFVELLEHKEQLSEVSDSQWLSFAVLNRVIEQAERSAFGATMFNWTCFMNNFYLMVPPKPHVHWHVKPRYDHDVVVLGKRFVDPNFGHHYDNSHLAHVSPEQKGAIAESLRAAAGSLDASR